jgi:hypothetical protein
MIKDIFVVRSNPSKSGTNDGVAPDLAVVTRILGTYLYELMLPQAPLIILVMLFASPKPLSCPVLP